MSNTGKLTIATDAWKNILMVYKENDFSNFLLNAYKKDENKER